MKKPSSNRYCCQIFHSNFPPPGFHIPILEVQHVKAGTWKWQNLIPNMNLFLFFCLTYGLMNLINLQDLIQLGKQGALISGLVYITKPIWTVHSLQQGKVTAQEPPAPEITIWHHLIYNLLRLSTITITRTLSIEGVSSTPINSYSMADQPIQSWELIVTTKTTSILILLRPWSKWVILARWPDLTER